VTTIEVAEAADADLVAAVSVLIPQLSSSSSMPTVDDLNRVIGDPATTLLLARDGAKVVGMLTLAVFTAPTGTRAWVEDVVVDDGARGAGVASTLVRAALDHAARQGARTVDLTSRPSREAANRLYVRLGFDQRQTNVYRFTIGTSGQDPR
jgi:ribosomal protein S18 acetylase RimI-like enzyme